MSPADASGPAPAFRRRALLLASAGALLLLVLVAVGVGPVPISIGEAIVLPARSSGLVIASSTTRNAPPDAVPATMRIASPSDCANALIAGLGPMNDASIASEKIASTASGPALKVVRSSVTLSPSASSMRPPSVPTSAGACVTFGK